MKKITFFITKSEPGGAQTHVLELAGALSRKHMEINVIAGDDGPLLDALEERGIVCRSLQNLVHPIRPWKDLMALREIKAELKSNPPDLLTTHSFKAGWLGRIAAHSLRIPVTFTSHGWLFNERVDHWSGWIYRKVEKFASRMTDRIINVSKKDFLSAQRCGIEPSKMVTVHNGLPDIPLALRGNPGADPPRIVMVARFASPKDHRTLLEALAGLKELNWFIDFIGDGPLQSQAEKMSRELGIADRTGFLGVCNDVPEKLAMYQVLLLISNREGFPISILEGMRAGLPVIASDVGGVSEAVVNGVTGFLVPRGDADRLRLCLAKLFINAELRVAMGTAGRRLFKKSFTLENMVERTITVYREILEK